MTEYTDTEEKEYTELRIDEHILIGEKHIRLGYNQEDNDSFSGLLEKNKDSIFVLEFNPSSPSAYADTKDSFMSQTFKYATDQNSDLVILDDEKINSNRFRMWKEAGSNISIEEFDYMSSLLFIQKELNTQSTEDILSTIENSSLDDTRKNTYYKVYEKYLSIFTENKGQEELNKIYNLISSFISYDSACREIYYQRKVSEIIKNNPERKIFAVFGESHLEGISKTIQDPNFRRNLPSGAKMKFQLSVVENLE